MPAEITFIANPGITPTDIVQVAQRLALVLTGKDYICRIDTTDERWVVGESNNHWLTYDKEKREFALRFRYSPGELELWVLRRAIIYLLGFHDWNASIQTEFSSLQKNLQVEEEKA